MAQLLASGDDGVIEEFSPYVEQYLGLIGRRIRPPFSVPLLLLSINSLFKGFALRYQTSPELVDRGDAGPSMYTVGLEALMMHFSGPVSSEPASPGPVDDGAQSGAG